MPLAHGLMLGPYEIEEPAGQGGMGEVYRARDSRLDRKVAIKILPDDLALRPDRRVRFEREARAIGALNHPNICALYDVGTHEGKTYLVMEFVEGETLEHAIARLDRSRSRTGKSGPALSNTASSGAAARPGLGRIERIYEIAGEIAEALEAAHRQGFVHRDLKPANVMLTRDGVKLLDFGLAKSTLLGDRAPGSPVPEPPASGGAASSPGARSGDQDTSAVRSSQGGKRVESAAEKSLDATRAALTQPEKIVGTLRYAAPEQLQGRTVDRRSDIFSFGAVLYEMLTGQKAFDGRTDVTLIAAILEQDPTPPSQFRRDIPAPLERLVLECLAKDPNDRWQSAGDIARQVRALAAGREQDRRTTQHFRGLNGGARRFLALGLILGGAIGVAASLARQPPAPPAPPAQELLRFSIDATGMVLPVRMALSPDGRQLGYVGRTTPDSPTGIFVRRMDTPVTVMVPGTSEASDFFWSPDGSEIGFVANRRLQRAPVAGGTPRILSDLDNRFFGGTWNRAGIIVFADEGGQLIKVSTGGDIEGPVFSDAVPRHHPIFLPDGAHLLFERPGKVSAGFYLAKLDGTGERQLKDLDGLPIVDATGRAAFQGGGNLSVRTFDLATLTLSPRVVRLATDLESSERRSFTISDEGTLAYLPFRARADAFVWVDRKGQALERQTSGLRNYSFSLSPDEKQVLLSATRTTERGRGCFLLDLRSGTTTLLVQEVDGNPIDDPIWAPDSKSFVYIAHRGPSVLLRRNLATGVETTLYAAKNGVALVEDWSDDGRTVVMFTREYPEPLRIVFLPVDGHAAPEVITPDSDDVDEIDLSPDGQLLVYQDRTDVEWDVYLRRRNGEGKTIRLSREGGLQPRFAPDGKSVYFLSPQGLMMQVQLPDPLDTAVPLPTVLFHTGIEWPSVNADQYRVSARGDRFLLSRPTMEDAQRIEMVRPWYRLYTEQPGP